MQNSAGVNPAFKGKILPEYVAKIEGGLNFWGGSFRRVFNETTFHKPVGKNV